MATKERAAPRKGSFAEQLQNAAECLEQLTEHRNELVVKRRRQGATLRDIADEARLSHTAIAKILKRSC